MAERLCLQCGTVGQTQRVMKGSLGVEILLWLFFLVPGLIYSIWRHTTVFQGCKRCGSANVIPLTSPVAQKFLAETKPGQPIEAYRAPVPAKSGMSGGMIAGIVVGILFLGAIVRVISVGESSSVAPTSAQVASNYVPSTGNEANDRLSALPASQQALSLGAVVEEGCVGKRAFYMGSSPADHSAFWSVGCKNGKSYLVQIFADASGSTKVLECGMYKLVTKMSCFAKITN